MIWIEKNASDTSTGLIVTLFFLLITPVYENLPGTGIATNFLAKAFNQNFLWRPPWIPFLESGILVLSGLVVIFLLPRLKTGIGIIVTSGLLIGYWVTGGVFFFASNIRLRVAPATLLLILANGLILLKRFFSAKKMKRKSKADILDSETNSIPAPSYDHKTPFDLTDNNKKKFGVYEIQEEIGKDAAGIVYKGYDPETYQSLAIRTVQLADFDTHVVNSIRKRFFKETSASHLLTHPNIISIYDYGTESDLLYIAQIYLPNRSSLERHTRKGNLLSIRKALSITSRVANALDYAHQKNIVHQDIRPESIIWSPETDDVKVTNFGIAWTASLTETTADFVPDRRSYMSPEQVSGKRVDRRSDIFSLGIVLYEMLTGERPFTGDDMTSLMFNIAKERHRSLKSVNPKIPRIIERIIDKALEKDPDKRYQRAGQMEIHLLRIVTRIDEILEKKRNKHK